MNPATYLIITKNRKEVKPKENSISWLDFKKLFEIVFSKDKK